MEKRLQRRTISPKLRIKSRKKEKKEKKEKLKNKISLKKAKIHQDLIKRGMPIKANQFGKPDVSRKRKKQII